MGLASAILEDEPPSLAEWRPDLPREFGQMVSRCLEKPRERRIQSAGEVKGALESMRTSEHAVAPVAVTGRSVAVLPFVNMSPNTDDEYFSDGITDEILNALTQIQGLRVAARLLATYGLEPPAGAMSRARDAARRALHLDPDLTEAHATPAEVAGLSDRDHEAAFRFRNRALEFRPGHTRARSERAIKLDPDSYLARFNLVQSLVWLEEWDRAVSAAGGAEGRASIIGAGAYDR